MTEVPLRPTASSLPIIIIIKDTKPTKPLPAPYPPSQPQVNRHNKREAPQSHRTLPKLAPPKNLCVGEPSQSYALLRCLATDSGADVHPGVWWRGGANPGMFESNAMICEEQWVLETPIGLEDWC